MSNVTNDAVYPSGARVEVHGLTARPDLNGRLGSVVDWANGRHGVNVDGESGPGVRIRPACLRAAPARPPPSPFLDAGKVATGRADEADADGNAEDELAMALMNPQELADAMLKDETEPGALDRAVDRQVARMRMLSTARQQRGLPVREYGSDRAAFWADVHAMANEAHGPPAGVMVSGEPLSESERAILREGGYAA